MSNFSKFQKAINIARTIRVNPTCLGIELIKSLAQNLDNRADIFNLYYNYQTELAPLTGLNRFLRRNSPRLRAQAVFGSLDSLMIGGHGSSRDQENQSVLLRGPAYFQLERSKSMLNLSVYEDNLNSFCSHLGSTPQATSQIRRTTQRAARSVN